MQVSNECYLFSATKMKIKWCGRRGGRRVKLQTVPGVLHTLYGFFNLISNNQSQTLDDAMFIIKKQITIDSYQY